MKSCFNTITAGESADLGDIIEACGSAGFAGIEIDARHLEPYIEAKGEAAFKAQIEANRLQVAALMAFPFYPFEEPDAEKLDRYALYAERAAKFGAGCLLTFIVGVPPEGMSEEEQFATAAENIRPYADAAAPHGIGVALELIGMAAFARKPAEVMRIIEGSERENVGIMMDTFHFYKSGVTTQEIAEIPAEKLMIVHVNDAPDLPRKTMQDSDRVYPGLGVLPLVEWFGVLEGKAYDGFLSVEIFNQSYWEQTPAKIALDAKRNLDLVLERLAATGG